MLKSELAREAGVSSKVFRTWLVETEKDLQPLGYRRTLHLLTPAMIVLLHEKYVIF